MAKLPKPRFSVVRVRTPRENNPLVPVDFNRRYTQPDDIRMPRMPRMPRFPAQPRFPSLVPGARPGEVYTTLQEATEAGFPPVPPWWTSRYPQGSDIEWAVYWWLSAHGVAFTYQFQGLGGRVEQGRGDPQVPDFYLPDGQLLLDVQGEYWHYSTTALRQKALFDKIDAQARGYTMVFLRELDLRTRLNDTMASAVRGEQEFSD